MGRRARRFPRLVAACLMAPSAMLLSAAPATAQHTDQLAAAIASLAAQVRAEIARLPAKASVQAFEAPILFVADQSGQPVTVICAALEEVKAEPATPANARIAMNDVCRMLRTRRGTGAVGGSSGRFGPSSFSGPVVSLFSAPAVSLGGGSSNYTPR